MTRPCIERFVVDTRLRRQLGRRDNQRAMAAGKTKARGKDAKPGKRTVDGWRANALDLRLSADDLGLLDNAITVIPILRVVVALGQEARRRGLEYPVSSVRELLLCLAGETLNFAGHEIDDDAIERTMPETWFPIAH
jgi:hypothetical protein